MMGLIWELMNVLPRELKTSCVCILSLFLFLNTSAQTQANEFILLFYNVENLFDVQNDPMTNDDEFTPEGERHWTFKRLQRKLLNTSRAIIASAGWKMPAIIALCEIENKYVLEELRNKTPLKFTPYKIIHKESPDFRGIDVALLYNTEEFYPLAYEYLPLKDKNGNIRYSREILYVTGIIGGLDTLHIFVNHWPSRYSGVMETRELRNEAAKLLRTHIDQILSLNDRAKIVVLGDFNDQPHDESISKFLTAKPVTEKTSVKELYNLSTLWAGLYSGTLKYQWQWYTFDQVMVSGGLLNAHNGLYTSPEWAGVSTLPFLFEEDRTYGGKKLSRTYNGYHYNGGFSDHLPIWLKLQTH